MSDTTDTPTDLTVTREGWLHRAAEVLGLMIEQVSGITLPPFHVSMGFGGLSYEKGVRGVCWKRVASDDGRNHVFISPELSDTGVVLAVLLHELIHVALDCEDGTPPRADGTRTSHRGQFAEFGTRLGLTAPFTTALPDIELTAQLMVIAAELGEFPHGALHVRQPAPVEQPVEQPVGILVGGGGKMTSGPGAQVNRWVSVTCPSHGGSVRMSRTRLAQGAPLCGVDEITDAGVNTCTLRMVAK